MADLRRVVTVSLIWRCAPGIGGPIDSNNKCGSRGFTSVTVDRAQLIDFHDPLDLDEESKSVAPSIP